MNARFNRCACISCALLCSFAVYAQKNLPFRVAPRNMYERVLAILPAAGSGTLVDPKRPMYAPTAAQMNSTSRSGILGYQCTESDDRKLLLCEFVAKNKAALQPILADNTVKSFLKGRDRIQDAIAEFQKHKKNFDINQLVVRVP